VKPRMECISMVPRLGEAQDGSVAIAYVARTRQLPQRGGSGAASQRSTVLAMLVHAA